MVMEIYSDHSLEIRHCCDQDKQTIELEMVKVKGSGGLSPCSDLSPLQ